ncbi:hypothetical protein PENSPDRAFT_663667 [Peniophora sp. CONT]|nr:hypothetical protein PENSPDRAFT_663667 [Peniophora sp. CONT]
MNHVRHADLAEPVWNPAGTRVYIAMVRVVFHVPATRMYHTYRLRRPQTNMGEIRSASNGHATAASVSAANSVKSVRRSADGSLEVKQALETKRPLKQHILVIRTFRVFAPRNAIQWMGFKTRSLCANYERAGETWSEDLKIEHPAVRETAVGARTGSVKSDQNRIPGRICGCSVSDWAWVNVYLQIARSHSSLIKGSSTTTGRLVYGKIDVFNSRLTDYVNLLNNILIQQRASHLLSWSFPQEGQGPNPGYSAVAKLRGEVVGHGTGRSPQDAKQLAAFRAIKALQILCLTYYEQAFTMMSKISDRLAGIDGWEKAQWFFSGATWEAGRKAHGRI